MSSKASSSAAAGKAELSRELAEKKQKLSRGKKEKKVSKGLAVLLQDVSENGKEGKHVVT
ncbi:MAG: hypothetical protein HC831_08300 [Chloroflexia bacterium]|nr:hypothetical protein [Chloroflexia bacterium]